MYVSGWIKSAKINYFYLLNNKHLYLVRRQPYCAIAYLQGINIIWNLLSYHPMLLNLKDWAFKMLTIQVKHANTQMWPLIWPHPVYIIDLVNVDVRWHSHSLSHTHINTLVVWGRRWRGRRKTTRQHHQHTHAHSHTHINKHPWPLAVRGSMFTLGHLLESPSFCVIAVTNARQLLCHLM